MIAMHLPSAQPRLASHQIRDPDPHAEIKEVIAIFEGLPPWARAKYIADLRAVPELGEMADGFERYARKLEQ